MTAQLIETATGGHLWAERYDRDLTDIFAVQDEITASVSAAILPTMDRSERERVARKPPDSLDAWEYCLAGKRPAWRQRHECGLARLDGDGDGVPCETNLPLG